MTRSRSNSWAILYGRYDVIGTVGVCPERDLLLHNRDHGLQPQVPRPPAVGGIVLGADQPLPQYRGDAHARHGALLEGTVHALGTLAEGDLHAHRRPHQHLFHRPPYHFHGSGLAADDVVAARHDPHRGDAGHEGIPEGDVLGVDGIQRTQVGNDGITHLVLVALIRPDAVLAQAEVGVGVDHPRDEHLAAHVPDLGVLRARRLRRRELRSFARRSTASRHCITPFDAVMMQAPVRASRMTPPVFPLQTVSGKPGPEACIGRLRRCGLGRV